WVIIFSLMTAYVGTLGQAVGVQREFSGLMSKPWRMVTLHLGAWAALLAILRNWDITKATNLTVLDWTCLLIIVGCIQTICIRLARILRALASKDEVRRLKDEPESTDEGYKDE